jgi:antitoxin component YwqK of YwqJK toxin-antitoxin module
MKSIITFALICLFTLTSFAQTNLEEQRMVPMSSTYQKAYKLGSIYYEIGTDQPYNGVLYGKYSNGNYMTMQEYKNGVGNGKWIDFDPMGNKVSEGTYVNNRVEGPVKFFYENGSLKSEGQYLHWKKPIGKWTYYDKDGNVAHVMTYTR